MVSETQRPTPFNRRSATRNVDYDLLPWVETHGYQQPSLRDENVGPYPKNGARLGWVLWTRIEENKVQIVKIAVYHGLQCGIASNLNRMSIVNRFTSQRIRVDKSMLDHRITVFFDRISAVEYLLCPRSTWQNSIFTHPLASGANARPRIWPIG